MVVTYDSALKKCHICDEVRSDVILFSGYTNTCLSKHEHYKLAMMMLLKKFFI